MSNNPEIGGPFSWLEIGSDRYALYEAAVDRELSLLRFHCENCRRLIRERALGVGSSADIMKHACPDGFVRPGETFEDVLPFFACVQVKLSIKMQAFFNSRPPNPPSRQFNRAFNRAYREALDETNDRFYGHMH